MARVIVLATGGTIASTRSSSPGATATESIEALLQSVDSGEHEVVGKDILTTGSYLLNHRDLRIIAHTVAEALEDASCDGVVLTHGTDTLEETAYLLDLVHSSSKPVVVTGAQRTPDSVGHDGELNLQDAIAVAGSPESSGRGVLITFAGCVYPARGTVKLHTTNPSPFGGVGACGYVADTPSVGAADGNGSSHSTKHVHFHAFPRRAQPLALPDEKFDATRVDVIVSHPGADATAAQACADAGAKGIIVLGTGAGNGNHALLLWARQAMESGITVGLATRVPHGSVLPLYGNGGASDFLDAGALSMGSLPWSQARILLALLLSQQQVISSDVLAEHI
ncbi:asparaginase [Corynebacterium casei]|uniref:asparaginase n=1 Tax=Corynebacterium casei TaxID=160386 RepID=UPI003F8DC60F